MKEGWINLLVAASVVILLGIWLLPDNTFASAKEESAVSMPYEITE